MPVKLTKPDYKKMNLLQFQKEFRTEEDCQHWLFSTRWPQGFQCPRCNQGEYTLLENRNLLMCRACRYQASITSGTVFHKTKTPLLKWFWLIYRMATSKTGVSIAEMQRELEIRDYKTIWTMAHKIRKGMSDRDGHYKLAGLVEVDESFFGPKKPGKRGRGAEGKSLVIVAVSTWTDKKGHERPGFAHALVVQDASAETIEGVLRRLSIPEDEIQPLINRIRTDGWKSYQKAARKLGVDHHRAVFTDPKDSMKLLPWTHRFIANAKAVMHNPHHGVSQKHLQSYLAEVCYRFNRRFWGQEAFHRLLNACASTDTITREKLMAPAEQSP